MENETEKSNAENAMTAGPAQTSIGSGDQADYQKQIEQYKSQLEEYQKRIEEYESRNKTELQRAQEAVAKEAAARAAVEKELNELRLSKIREEVGQKYGIPSADRDRLRGTDAKTIEEDAKAWMKARGATVGGPTPPGLGIAPVNENSIMNDLILRAAGRGGR